MLFKVAYPEICSLERLLPSLLLLFPHLPPIYFSLQKETARLAEGMVHQCECSQLQMSGAPPERNSCCVTQHPLSRVGKDPGESWEANEVKLVWLIARDQTDALTEAPDKDGPVNHIFNFHRNSAFMDRKWKRGTFPLPSSKSYVFCWCPCSLRVYMNNI